MTQLLRCAGFSVALFLAVRWPAQAHAILLRSFPSANQAVNGKAVPLELYFNSRVDGKRSRLSLIDPEGTDHDLKIEQPSADSVVSRAANLHPGTYVLRWQILAEDGHITRGEVLFRVN